MRAWLQPPGEIESLDGWLRAVALNCARSDLRRRDAEARALGRLGIPAGSADGQEDVVGRLAWAEALVHLPGGQRRAVALHYFEDRSVEDVAAELGVSTGTVKSQLHRARARLAGLLGRTEAVAGPEEMRKMTVKDWFLAGSHPHEYEHQLVAEQTEYPSPWSSSGAWPTSREASARSCSSARRTTSSATGSASPAT